MKILITGGAGFIGRHIAGHFQSEAEVRVLDNLRSGFRRNLDGLKHEFVEGSVLDRGLVRSAMHGIDYVFHLAALVSVPESMEKPDECAEINTIGTKIVLEEAACAGARKLVFSSSAAIYGDSPVVPKTERVEAAPKSPYASTKLAGEELCARFAARKQIATISLRYFNVFGPFQDPRSQYAAAIPAFVERALANEPILVHGDGEQTRDFIFARDVARANAFFARQPSLTGVFNIARGRGTSVNELSAMIRQLTGSSSTIEHGVERPGDIKHSVAAVEEAAKAGFTAESTLVDGLRTTIKYFHLAR